MAEAYSSDVWDALKLLWEATPKISWQKLVDTVGADLDCEMPNPSVVRRRSINENWQKGIEKALRRSSKANTDKAMRKTSKRTSKTAKSDVKSDVKKDSDNDTESDVENDDQDFDNDHESKEKNYELLTSDCGQKERQNHTEKRAAAAKVNANLMLTSIRKQVWRQMKMHDVIFDSLDHVQEEHAVIIRMQNEGIPVDDDRLSGVTRKMNFVVGLAELNDMTTRAMERSHRAAAFFWGMNADDFIDKGDVEAKTKQQLAILDTQYKLEQERLRLERVEQMERRAAQMAEDDFDSEAQLTSDA